MLLKNDHFKLSETMGFNLKSFANRSTNKLILFILSCFCFAFKKLNNIRIIFLIAFTLGSQACSTVSPLDGKVLTSIRSTIPVVGFWLLPSKPLYILASPAPEGPWTVLTTVTSSASPVYFGGKRHYTFNARVQIPADLWRVPPSGCASHETYMGIGAALPATPALFSLEDEMLSGTNPFACLEDNDYDTSKCASRRSPLTRLLVDSQITRHIGDTIIRNLSDHARHRCYDSIAGNLRIENTVGAIDMPELRDVIGDVVLEYPVQADSGSAHIGRAVQRNFPQLARIEGSLRATARGASGTSREYTLRILEPNIPHLQTVGGDVELLNLGLGGETVGANGSFRGLGALTYIGGDVRFSNHPDRHFNTLNAVRRVEGTVYLGSGKINGTVFETLQTIGSDLDIPQTRIKSEVLSNLTSIEGNARLAFHKIGVATAADRNLISLEQVGGTLQLSNSAREDFSLGAFPVSVGQLVIENNDRLIDIQPGEVEVRGRGEVRFTNNPLLCRSRIQTFISTLVGWTGLSTVTGNGSC